MSFIAVFSFFDKANCLTNEFYPECWVLVFVYDYSLNPNPVFGLFA